MWDAARRTVPAHTCEPIHYTFSPLTRPKTIAQAPKLVLPESAAEALPRRSLAHQLCAAPAAAAEEVENAGINSPPPDHTSAKRRIEDAAPLAPARLGKRAAGRGGVSCKSPSLDLSTPVIGVSSSLKTRLELLHRLTA